MIVPETHLYFIVLVDIEDFSLRPDSVQLALQKGVYDVVRSALKRARVDSDDMEMSDRGDGMLVLIPASLSPPVLLRELVRGLEDALADHRRAHSDGYRMRLRVGFHLGLVSRDGQRWAGTTINDLARLLDADHVRKSLKVAESAHMVFVLPDSLYSGIVQGYHSGINPALYVPFEFVTKHHEARRGWLIVPGHPAAPGSLTAGRTGPTTATPDGSDDDGGLPRTAGDTSEPGMSFVNRGTNHGTIVQARSVHGNTFGR